MVRLPAAVAVVVSRLLIFDYFFKGLNKVRDTRTGSGALFVSLPMLHSARTACAWPDKAMTIYFVPRDAAAFP